MCYEPENFVMCRICGREFQRIIHSHLKKHNITPEEYQNKFSKAPIVTNKYRRKLREVATGKTPSKETRDKISVGNQGKIRTEETKSQIRETLKITNARPEVKARRSAASSEAQNRLETKAKQRARMMGDRNHMYGRTGKNSPAYGRTGMKHPMFGKTFTHTEAAIAKMSGEGNPNWKGGVSSDPQYNKRRCLRRLGLPEDFIEMALVHKPDRSDIELAIEYWLLRYGVDYDYQKSVSFKEVGGTCTRIDFDIEAAKVALYTDGVYYHYGKIRRNGKTAHESTDADQNKYLPMLGYKKVIRLTGTEIRAGGRPWEILEMLNIPLPPRFEQQSLEAAG